MERPEKYDLCWRDLEVSVEFSDSAGNEFKWPPSPELCPYLSLNDPTRRYTPVILRNWSNIYTFAHRVWAFKGRNVSNSQVIKVNALNSYSKTLNKFFDLENYFYPETFECFKWDGGALTNLYYEALPETSRYLVPTLVDRTTWKISILETQAFQDRVTSVLERKFAYMGAYVSALVCLILSDLNSREPFEIPDDYLLEGQVREVMLRLKDFVDRQGLMSPSVRIECLEKLSEVSPYMKIVATELSRQEGQ